MELLQGEVGVSYFPRPLREILPESQLTLVDRMYQPGDLLKRSIDDVVSGVVTRYVVLYVIVLRRTQASINSIGVKGRLEHAISGELIPQWKNASDAEAAIDVDMGDYVVYDDWIGQVIVFNRDWFALHTDSRTGGRGNPIFSQLYKHSY